MLGAATSAPEVTNVSMHGLWVLLEGEELFLPFEYFPWFKKATIEQLSKIDRPTSEHLYWPMLDVDLSVASIRDPASFPLSSRAGV